MARQTTYNCNLCAEEKKPSDMQGYTMPKTQAHTEGRLKPADDASKATIHICANCSNSLAQFYFG